MLFAALVVGNLHTRMFGGHPINHPRQFKHLFIPEHGSCAKPQMVKMLFRQLRHLLPHVVVGNLHSRIFGGHPINHPSLQGSKDALCRTSWQETYTLVSMSLWVIQKVFRTPTKGCHLYQFFSYNLSSQFCKKDKLQAEGKTKDSKIHVDECEDNDAAP